MFSGKILAGWLIDGSGRPALKNVTLTIGEGIIQAVEPDGERDMRSGAFIDLTNSTLLPGLIDSHVHLCLPDGAAPAHHDLSARDGGAGKEALIAHRLRQYASYGIMAVRDGGDRFEMVLRYQKKRTPGEESKVAIHTPGSAFYKRGRYGGFIGKEIAEGETLSDAVSAQAPRVDHIKILNSGINSLTQFGRETPPQFTREQLRQAVLMAAHFDRSVMVHANGPAPVGMAIEAGCRSIEHGYFMGKENLLKMRDKGVIWVPTAIPMKAYADILAPGTVEADVARRTLDHQLRQMVQARELGVLVAAGSDAGSPGVEHGAGLVEELKLLRLAGYSIEEAIRCASLNGAALISSRISGRIVTGEKAVFLVVPGSPDRLPESLINVHQVGVADGSSLTQQP
ncbi:MAG: amidohydrolase family protein [Pseudomonadota bacterium]